MSSIPQASKQITVSELRSYINGVIGSTPDFHTIKEPIAFLMQKCFQHFKGGVSPVILRPLLYVEVYKEDVVRMVIENVRRDMVNLRDFTLDYPNINRCLDLIDNELVVLIDKVENIKASDAN